MSTPRCIEQTSDRRSTSMRDVVNLTELFEASASNVDQTGIISTNCSTASPRRDSTERSPPTSLGGLELTSRRCVTSSRPLAAANLSPTFVWMQHFRLSGGVDGPLDAR